MRLQIAFQGGGAKLALLLPVVEALLYLEGTGEISISRVSGTSAGAIAAALAAGKANMGALRQFLIQLAKDRGAFDKAIPKVSSMNLLQKGKLLANLLLRNKPLARDSEISRILDDGLRAAGLSGTTPVGQLGRPCFILSANIARHERIIAAETDMLLQALMDSTALPFVFRTTGDRVDGGLLNNLPVEALLTPESPASEHGEIVAVSFSENSFLSPSTSALSLASTLLDAAITSKTRSSRMLIGASNVYDVPHVVGTIRVESFDVESFFRFVGDANAYLNVYNDAIAWFRNFLTAKKAEQEAARRLSTAAGEPDDASQVLKAQSGDLRRLAEAYHQHQNLVQTESILEIVAYSLTDEGQAEKRDMVRFIDRFRSTAGPIHMFSTRLFAANAAAASAKDIKIFNSMKEPIPFVSFGVMDERDDARWTLHCFLKPVLGPDEPDGIITIVQEQEVSDVMLPLKRQGADYLGTLVSQAVMAEIVEIRLCVPASFGTLSLDNGTFEEIRALELGDDPFVREADIVVPGTAKGHVVEACPPKFTSYVWQARNCNRNETVRVIYRRKKAHLTN